MFVPIFSILLWHDNEKYFSYAIFKIKMMKTKDCIILLREIFIFITSNSCQQKHNNDQFEKMTYVPCML